MGVYHEYDVICPVCEGRFTANLVNSVNVTRFPGLKEKLLNRQINRVRCPSCGKISIVEKPFFYSDFRRKQFIAVYPRKERHFHERASEQAHAVFNPFAALKYSNPRNSRVAFGLEELREKVVAADNDIDDHALELLKLYVIREHPFLIDQQRLRITLNSIDAEKAEFHCTFDLKRDYFKAYVPRAFFGTLRGASPDKAATGSPFPRARNLAKKMAFAPDGKTPWVNFWGLNPSNDALSLLSKFAEAIRANEAVNPDDPAFKKMLKTLPNGNQLPNWAKRDLQTIDEFARAVDRPDIEARVFKIRFGFGLEDDWFKNADEEDVRTIWTLLKDLPDIAVEGNTWIKAIYLDQGDDGGLYDPSTKEIHIGSKIESGTNVFRNVVLHEVGHAVQEKFDREKKNVITKWLAAKFAWQMFDPTSTQIDAWIELMGGYPPGTTVQVKTQVRSYIQQSIGPGNTFKAAKIVNGPQGHLWNDKNFGPRRAFELTGSNWHERCDQWHKHDGKRFFVNYHYTQLMVVDDATVKLVAGTMPDRYAAMSPFEFYAELFAWYYDSQSPNRAAIPQSVSGWFLENVGSLDLSSPFAPHRPPPRRSRSTAKRRRR